MGMSITIGNAQPVTQRDGERVFEWTIDDVTVATAPTWEDQDPARFQANWMCNGYGEWEAFVVAVGLLDLLTQNGLKRGVQGDLCSPDQLTPVPLLPRHVATIQQAVARWRRKHPDAVGRYGTTQVDGWTARLEWLLWWSEWALANCEHPAVMLR